MAKLDPISETRLTRWVLIGISLAFFALIIFLPLVIVFVEALHKGLGTYLAALHDAETLAALRLTFTVAAIAVPFNALLGVCAAWSVTKYSFAGKNLLLSLIDLPFSVSPVISGLIYVLLFGAHGWLGPLVKAHDLEIIFAVPGIILATTFVTFPFVARELIPLMQAQGSEEEEAGLFFLRPLRLHQRNELACHKGKGHKSGGKNNAGHRKDDFQIMGFYQWTQPTMRPKEQHIDEPRDYGRHGKRKIDQGEQKILARETVFGDTPSRTDAQQRIERNGNGSNRECETQGSQGFCVMQCGKICAQTFVQCLNEHNHQRQEDDERKKGQADADQDPAGETGFTDRVKLCHAVPLAWIEAC